ncbi:Hypothetical protein CINCED_3A000975, partial [Cinara cedri]
MDTTTIVKRSSTYTENDTSVNKALIADVSRLIGEKRQLSLSPTDCAYSEKLKESSPESDEKQP